MARGLNKVMLIGNLGKDPEVRYTQDGSQAVVNFTLATSMEWRDKATGEKREKTEWHRLVAFGKLGEICGQYLSKGKQVYVEGRLQTRSWEQDGVTRYTTEIVVSDMQMLGSARGGDNSGYGNYQSEPAAAASAPSGRGGHGGGSAPQNNSVQQPPADTFDDDIPF